MLTAGTVCATSTYELRHLFSVLAGVYVDIPLSVTKKSGSFEYLMHFLHRSVCFVGEPRANTEQARVRVSISGIPTLALKATKG